MLSSLSFPEATASPIDIDDIDAIDAIDGVEKDDTDLLMDDGSALRPLQQVEAQRYLYVKLYGIILNIRKHFLFFIKIESILKPKYDLILLLFSPFH